MKLEVMGLYRHPDDVGMKQGMASVIIEVMEKEDGKIVIPQKEWEKHTRTIFRYDKI